MKPIIKETIISCAYNTLAIAFIIVFLSYTGFRKDPAISMYDYCYYFFSALWPLFVIGAIISPAVAKLRLYLLKKIKKNSR